jgi:hypothetical protein
MNDNKDLRVGDCVKYIADETNLFADREVTIAIESNNCVGIVVETKAPIEDLVYPLYVLFGDVVVGLELHEVEKL